MTKISTKLFRLASLFALLPVVISASNLERVCIALGVLIISLLRTTEAPNRSGLNAGLVLGLSIPLVPWLGAHVIPGLVLGSVLISSSRTHYDYSITWALPFAAYIFGSLGSEAALAFSGSPLVNDLFNSAKSFDLGRASDSLRSIATTSLPSLPYLSNVVLFATVVAFLETRVALRRSWVIGIVWGALGLSLFTITQWLFWPTFNLRNQTNFWTSINRLSGLATDPNACGVLLGFTLCLIVIARRSEISVPLPRISLPLVATAGLLTGSRTFLLICALLGLALALNRNRRLIFLAPVATLVVVSFVTVLDTSTPYLSDLLQNQAIPEGIKRGLQALSIGRFPTTVFSRSAFFTIGREIFSHSMLFGVGPNQFRNYVSLIGGELGLLSGWSDNSNNFYLGILSELGLVGALSFCASLLLRRTTHGGGNRSASRGILIIIGLSLLTGPHTDAPEVLLLVSSIVALTTAERRNPTLASYPALITFLFLGAIGVGSREIGAYGWEGSPQALTRWLSPKARINLPCSPDPLSLSGEAKATILIRTPTMPNHEKVTVEIKAAGGQKITYNFSDPTAKRVPLSCPRYQSDLSVTITSAPPWAPYWVSPSSEDRRILSVQQVYLH